MIGLTAMFGPKKDDLWEVGSVSAAADGRKRSQASPVDVPDDDVFISPTCRTQTIRGKLHRVNLPDRPVVGLRFLASGGIPKGDRAVLPGRRQPASIGGKGDSIEMCIRTTRSNDSRGAGGEVAKHDRGLGRSAPPPDP